MTKPTKAEVMTAARDAILACQKLAKLFEEDHPAKRAVDTAVLSLCLVVSIVEHTS